MNRLAVAAFLMGCAGPLAAQSLSETSKSEIEQLLSALGDSPCELYRNGTWHEGADAQEQLRHAYDDFAASGQIASTEQFIDRAGAGADQVRCPGEQPQPSARWLTQQLAQVRKKPVTDPNVYLGQPK